MLALVGKRRVSQTGWLRAFSPHRRPSERPHAGLVERQAGPSSARSKLSLNGPSSAGSSAARAGAGVTGGTVSEPAAAGGDDGWRSSWESRGTQPDPTQQKPITRARQSANGRRMPEENPRSRSATSPKQHLWSWPECGIARRWTPRRAPPPRWNCRSVPRCSRSRWSASGSRCVRIVLAPPRSRRRCSAAACPARSGGSWPDWIQTARPGSGSLPSGSRWRSASCAARSPPAAAQRARTRARSAASAAISALAAPPCSALAPWCWQTRSCSRAAAWAHYWAGDCRWTAHCSAASLPRAAAFDVNRCAFVPGSMGWRRRSGWRSRSARSGPTYRALRAPPSWAPAARAYCCVGWRWASAQGSAFMARASWWSL